MIAYPINWRLTAEEIARIVERAAPRLLLVDDSTLPLVADWPHTRADIAFWYTLGSTDAPGFTPFETLYHTAGELGPCVVAPDDPFAVISTAAVDIMPRGAVLTHTNLLMANLQTMACMGLTETDVLTASDAFLAATTSRGLRSEYGASSFGAFVQLGLYVP